MPEPRDLDGDFAPLEDGEKVSLVEYDGTLQEFEPVAVDLDQWDEFIQKCREMGWEQVELHAAHNAPVLAREQGDTGDVFVAVSPMLVPRPDESGGDSGGGDEPVLGPDSGPEEDW